MLIFELKNDLLTEKVSFISKSTRIKNASNDHTQLSRYQHF
jgi:hypothetical protein